MATAKIEKETFEVPCKIYGCNKRADYKIGNMAGSPAAFFHVCKDHAKDIAENLPKELLPAPKEVKVYPTEEELKELLNVISKDEIPFTDIEEPEIPPKKPTAKKKVKK